MSVDGEHGEAVDEEEERIESLRQQKAKDKSAFTRIKNKLLSLLDEEDHPSRGRSRRRVKSSVKCKNAQCQQWKNYLKNI